MDRPETTELLERARAGSREALDRLFDRYGRKLLGLIRLRMGPSLRSRAESRDVLNASLLAAFEGFDRLEAANGRALMGWLARIAENEIRDLADYHGRERRRPSREVVPARGLDSLAAPIRSLTSRLEIDERMQRLERALESLDEIQREVILLRKLEELSFAEIGERMGRSPDACRMLLARAMTALTLRMREEP